MTEADLERRLAFGILRSRINVALRWGAAALGASLAAGAALVVCARFHRAWEASVFGAFWAPLALTLGVAWWGLLRTRPRAAAVAFEMDRRAGLAEHFVTWEDFRHRPSPADPLARSFILAQRASALRAAERLNPTRHLPLVLPPWSRALWLGVLALGCAVLLPPQEPSLRGAALASGGSAAPSSQGAGAAGPGAPRPLGETAPSAFRVNPLSQTDLLEARLYLMDGTKSAEDYARLLERLLGKLGGLPDADLSDVARELLGRLRKKAGVTAPDTKAAEGTRSAAGADSLPKPAAVRTQTGVPEAALERSLPAGVVRERFPDVAEEVERYFAARDGK